MKTSHRYFKLTSRNCSLTFSLVYPARVTTRLFSLTDGGSTGVEAGVMLGTVAVLGDSTTRVGSTTADASGIMIYI